MGFCTRGSITEMSLRNFQSLSISLSEVQTIGSQGPDGCIPQSAAECEHGHGPYSPVNSYRSLKLQPTRDVCVVCLPGIDLISYLICAPSAIRGRAQRIKLRMGSVSPTITWTFGLETSVSPHRPLVRNKFISTATLFCNRHG